MQLHTNVRICQFSLKKSITDLSSIYESTELNSKLIAPTNRDVFLTGYTAGFWTSGGKNICFSVPVGFNLFEINSVKAVEIRLTIRQNNGYCYGSASGHETVNLSTDSTTIKIVKDMSQINFSITFPSVRAKINNDAAGISYSISLRLQE